MFRRLGHRILPGVLKFSFSQKHSNDNVMSGILFRSAYILKQDSLPQSYKSFLNKHGGKDPAILNGVREIACGLPFTNLGAIEKLYKSNGVDIKLDPQMKIPCSVCPTTLI